MTSTPEQTNSKICYTCGHAFIWGQKEGDKFIRLQLDGLPHICSNKSGTSQPQMKEQEQKTVEVHKNGSGRTPEELALLKVSAYLKIAEACNNIAAAIRESSKAKEVTA